MIESKAFYRKIEHAFAGSDSARTRERFAESFAPRLLEYLGGALGLEAVHLYDRRAGDLTPARRWGASRPDIGATPWAGVVVSPNPGLAYDRAASRAATRTAPTRLDSSATPFPAIS